MWPSEPRRRPAERITLGLLDRMGDAPGLDAAQRSWLLQDLREDLDVSDSPLPEPRGAAR